MKNYFFLGGLILLMVIIFRSWFSLELIAGGDFQIYYPEMFKDLSGSLSAWNWTLRSGLGANGASLLWNYLMVSFPISILGSVFNLDWQLIQRLGYLYPFLILVIISPYIFFKRFFGLPWVFLSIFIFSFNTYILMLTAGGQIFLSLAYALIPLVFMVFYDLLRTKYRTISDRMPGVLAAGLLFSLQLLFDVRIAYITLAVIAVYSFTAILFFRASYRNLVNYLVVFAITGALHAFWVLPTLLLRQNPLGALGSEFVSVGIIDFFSFARFENTISLLQPNWPENIFGKTYFFKPEFLILPLLAFSSLLLIKKEKREIRELVIFFAITALLFAFLSKGTSDPFGKLYSWMFNNIPGFVMFRDPTKWYGGIALSYAFLVPFTVKKIYEKIKSGNIPLTNNKFFNPQNLFILVFVFYLLFLIRPALLGQIGGVFKATIIPSDYLRLKEFISEKPDYFRTFWVPQSSKYSFFSSDHPLITGTGILGKYSDSILLQLSKDSSLKTLQEASVRYIIVPSDPDGTIFLTERAYDEKKYLKTVSEVQKLPYATEINGFGKIKVFEIPSPKDHFFGTRQGLGLSWIRKSSSEYILSIKNARKGDIVVFSETFDKNWEASNRELGFLAKSTPYNEFFNSFTLPADGEYSLRVYYKPQDFVNYGIIISLAGIGVIAVSCIYYLIRLKNGRAKQKNDKIAT